MNAISPSQRPLRHQRIRLRMHLLSSGCHSTLTLRRTMTPSRSLTQSRKGPYSAVNPLWMITAALAFFLAAMAILISS